MNRYLLYLVLSNFTFKKQVLEGKKKAVALVSGGMDSLVTLAIAKEKFHVALLHVSYDQRTVDREKQAFQEIADHYGLQERLITRAALLGQIGGSSLTDNSVPVAEANLNSLDIPSSYVPFRNAHFLSCAVSWAEVIGASVIFVGAVAEDSSGYPDCRREFYDAFEQLVETGTKPETVISIITPIIHLKKRDIILKGAELNAPFHLTWSCYRNSVKACGTCESCVLRLRGFKQAGIEDPIEYE